MTSTTDANSTTTYTYDGDATRLSAASGAGTTGYLWDIHSETPLLAVERDGSGNPLRSYEYGLGIVGMVAGGQQYYFHRDAIGSIRGLTSASGQPEWTYSFEPFGSIRAETKIDPMAPDVTLRFAGQLSDPETGGYDLWQRMYDAETGRFASPDPLPTPVDQPYVSTYAYGENQPTVLTDPTGLGAVRAGDVCGTSFMCILGEHVAAAPGRCWRAINPLSSAATYLDVAKSIALHRFKGKAVKEAAKLGLKDWGYDLPWFTAGACINGIATGH